MEWFCYVQQNFKASDISLSCIYFGYSLNITGDVYSIAQFLTEMDNSQNTACNNLNLCVLSPLALLEPTPSAYMCAHTQ